MFPNQDPPAGWPKPSGAARRVSSIVFFSLCTLLNVVVAVTAIGDRQFDQVAFSGLGVLLFGHLAGMSISFLRSPRATTSRPAVGVTDQGERGLAFPYARRSYYWLTSVLVLIVIFFAGLAYALAKAGTPVGWVIVVVAIAGALFIVWFLATSLRLAPGGIVVTPSGIYHRSLTFEHFVPWHAVELVRAREGRSPWILVKALRASETRERRYTGFLGAGAEGLPSMMVRAYWLGANAIPAYLTIKHYFDSPDERSKLGAPDQTANR
jgi:hypothetical protein